MFKSTDLYIDLGTANTLIYIKKSGLVLNEPSVLTVKNNSKNSSQLFATGHEAKLMLGKTPENLSVLRPLKEGVISDFDSTAAMLHKFITQIKKQLFWFRPRLIISLPCQVSQFEKKAVEEIGYNLGAKKVHLLHEPVAAAIGASLPVLSNSGSMIVDIGGGTTEIAIIAMGGIINAQAVRIGGNNIDEAIIDLMASQYRMGIGELTAEKIKIKVGSALLSKATTIVAGLDLTTGLPKKFQISSQMVYPAIDNVVSQIITSIKKAFESCPPEISADIASQGITLTGGGALIHGLSHRISEAIGVPVNIADHPLFSVALGGAKALEDNRLFDALEQPA